MSGHSQSIDWSLVTAEIAVAGRMAEAILCQSPAEIAAMPAGALTMMRGILADQSDMARAAVLLIEQAEHHLAG